ncbi:MAG: DUF1801 domain-containing protein [Chitinophagaceae bacterium]|nr:DUF1801 domain-containing protein [Chitinophagaceae bacterium]
MAKITASATSESIPSQKEAVDAYMKKLKHPMKEDAQLIREIILDAGNNIGEEIAWNAPSFYYTGKMKPFAPKEYKRFIAGLNFFKKDSLRLIFLRGALANDKTGMLQGDYKDGRRLAVFSSIAEIKAKKKDLQKVVKTIVNKMDK